MDSINDDYFKDVNLIQTAKGSRQIEKAIKGLMHLRNTVVERYPELIDSVADIDYHLACAAYRINNINLFEQTVQIHYYDDYRFKNLYQSFLEMETANVWNNIIKANASNLEKTFVRSLSVVILTCICLSLAFRN